MNAENFQEWLRDAAINYVTCLQEYYAGTRIADGHSQEPYKPHDEQLAAVALSSSTHSPTYITLLQACIHMQPAYRSWITWFDRALPAQYPTN